MQVGTHDLLSLSVLLQQCSCPFHRPFDLYFAALPLVRTSRAFAQQGDFSAQTMQELQVILEQRAAEIQRLKSEKESLQAMASQLSSHQATVVNENKILKRAIAIQQERRSHMTAELEGAIQFKVEAEDRICMLEQMNATLQYRLEVNMASENDYMWLSRRQ